MAVLDSMGLSGSVGEVTLYKRNGKLVMRKKRNNSSSKQRSAAQLKNELEFKVAHAWVKPVLEFVKTGFRNYGAYEQSFNAAKAYIKMNALREESGEISVDPALARVSMGPLKNPQDLQVSLLEDRLLQFSWDPALEDRMSPRDRIMMLAYKTSSGKAVFKVDGPFRREGTGSLDISKLVSGTVHIYAAFLSEKGAAQSESIYLGALVL